VFFRVKRPLQTAQSSFDNPFHQIARIAPPENEIVVLWVVQSYIMASESIALLPLAARLFVLPVDSFALCARYSFAIQILQSFIRQSGLKNGLYATLIPYHKEE
jgi:hypothetical protein